MGRWTVRRAARLVTAATVAAILGLTAAATAHAVTVPHSGWKWGLPQPQGNSLREVEFAGNRGYAVGAFGTLLRSDDGGTSWTGVPTDATADLSVLEIAGQPDSLVFGGACGLWRSNDGGRTLSGSFGAPTCDSSDRVLDASFPSPDIGYVLLRSGRVLRTIGGGLSSGDLVAPVPNVSYPVDMEFVSRSTGVAITGAGYIFRTTDGAASWTQVVSGESNGELASVHFVDASTGYAVGNQTWLKTTDGGATWRALAIPPGANRQLEQIRCADANTCLITNLFPGTGLLRTADGGATASQVATQAVVVAVAFASPTRAVAVGAVPGYGSTYRSATTVSDDGGLTWREVGSAVAHPLTGIRAKTENTAFGFGGRGLVRTTDGGRIWRSLGEIPLLRGDDAILDVSFPAATVGYVLDNNGRVRRSASGGTTWQVVSERQFAYALHAPDPSTVLLIGGRGIRRSTDGGRQFQPATAGRFAPGGTRELARAELTAIDQAGRTLVASGPHALYISRDQGRTWRKLRRPGRGLFGTVRPQLDAVDFLDARVGYAVAGGRLYFTRHGGGLWREVAATGSDGIYDVAFSSELSGWVAVKERFGRGPASEDGSYVLRTTNGGRSWRPQLVGERATLSLAAAGGTGLIAFNRLQANRSVGSGLLYTHAGGDSGAASALTLTTALRRLPRRARITVRGRLAPRGTGRVVIAYRGEFFTEVFGRRQRLRYTTWQYVSTPVAPDGTFSRRFAVDGTAQFVALFPGDHVRRPAGSEVLQVTAEGPF